MLQFLVIQHRAEQSHGVLFILRLVTGFGVLDEDFLFLARVGVFVLVTQTHTRLHLVHILTACTAASERIPRDAGLLDVHFDGVVNQWRYEHTGEAGHSLALCIIGTYTYQAVHTVLTLEETIGIFALNLQCASLDACIIAVYQVAHHALITVCLGPAHIHSHEHLCPVLCFGAACTRVYLQYCIHGIFLLTQHILQFESLDGFDGLGIHAIHFLLGDQFLLVEVEGGLQFVGHCLHLLIALDPLLQPLDQLHLRLCPLLVIPEARCLSAQLLLLILHLLGIDIQVAMKLFCSLLYVFQLFCCNHFLSIYVILRTSCLSAPCSSGR